MGRSQRHKVIIQGTDSSGKGLSEKQPAPRYINQYANSQAFSVWSGASGGPLQGSSMVGAPPTLIPLPGLMSERSTELESTGSFSDPGQFNLSGNPIYTDLPASNEPGPPPTNLAPTIASIDPPSGVVGQAVQITITGTGFTSDSVVHVNGNGVVGAYVSDTEMTADLPSFGVSQELAVTVLTGGAESNAVPFQIEDAAQSQGRSFPLGPFAILLVHQDAEGTLSFDTDTSQIQVGDEVTVEATGSTPANGSYTVTAVDGQTFVVDTAITLNAPIEGKGRVTITGGS